MFACMELECALMVFNAFQMCQFMRQTHCGSVVRIYNIAPNRAFNRSTACVNCRAKCSLKINIGHQLSLLKHHDARTAELFAAINNGLYYLEKFIVRCLSLMRSLMKSRLLVFRSAEIQVEIQTSYEMTSFDTSKKTDINNMMSNLRCMSG